MPGRFIVLVLFNQSLVSLVAPLDIFSEVLLELVFLVNGMSGLELINWHNVLVVYVPFVLF